MFESFLLQTIYKDKLKFSGVSPRPRIFIAEQLD